MKKFLSAALLVLVPVTASAEYGNELSRWSGPSQQQNDAPKPADATPAPAAADKPAGPATVEKTEEKKDEKVSAGSAVLTPEQLAKLQGFFFSASIDQYMGLGTFVNPNLYANVGTWVNAFISYRRQIGGRAFSLGVQPFGPQGVTYEYTMPDNDTGRRVVYTDARIALSMPALYKDKTTGIVLTPNFNVIIPTTPESFHAGLITRLGLGFGANRVFGLPVGSLMAGLGGFATYGIYTRTANVTVPDNKRDPMGNRVVLARGGDQYASIAHNNAAIAFQGSVGLTWLANDWLFFSVGYGVIASWKYAATNQIDQYTPKGTTDSGQGVAATGMSSSQNQWGSASVAVNITDVISASLYIYNLAPMMTADYKSVRFPFVDVTGLPNNYTILGLSLSATF